jgi:UDPglucose 6-dehydrogenase
MQPESEIAIIGHGYVGKAMDDMLSRNHPIAIFDPKESISFPHDGFRDSQLAIVCVPTDSRENGSCDTSTVEEVVSKIMSPLILIKSTVSPGTTERLKENTGKRICFSPEYIGESDYYNPYWPTASDVPFFIVGGDRPDTEEIISIFEITLGPTKRYYQCTATEAEMMKYMENAFFACKVTFVNEFYEICNAFGVSWNAVREGWLLDDRINRMHTSVFRTRRGFSGKCLPKDLQAIVQACECKGYTPELLISLLERNKDFLRMVDRPENVSER